MWKRDLPENAGQITGPMAVIGSGGVTISGDDELRGLLRIGQICGLALEHVGARIEPGIPTAELDRIAGEFLAREGAHSAPMLAYDFPGHICVSINEQAAHGVPGARRVRAGDLVNVDISAELEGFWADTGATFAVAPVPAKRERLCRYARRALDAALAAVRADAPIHGVGRAVQDIAARGGYSPIRELCGHGIGRSIHEPPQVPNFFEASNCDVFREGMVVAIEPFLTPGRGQLCTQRDGWTLSTTDGAPSAQYEHTVVVTDREPILATAV